MVNYAATTSGDHTTEPQGEAESRHKVGLSVCLLVTDIDSLTGGIQKQSHHLLLELNRRGVGTYVCARNYCGKPRQEIQKGVFIHRSPVISRSLPALNSILYLVDALAWLIRNRKRYQVIHCQQMFGAAMVGLLAKKLLHKPVVVRVTTSGELGEVRHLPQMPLAGWRLRQLRGVDGWVALTAAMKGEIHTLGVPSERVSIISNAAEIPVDASFDPVARERYRASLGLSYRPLVVFSGRLSQEKGLDTLLQAWKLLHSQRPPAHLLLLGEGGAFRNVEAALRALCRDLKLDEVVHFLGHLPNVGEYLLASDVFVLPTRAEGMSNALIEAMAAGMAIVTTDIPANRELFQDEVNALLVRPDDSQGLATAISRLLADPPLARRLGQAAREKAIGDLSVAAMATRYLALYSRLTAL